MPILTTSEYKTCRGIQVSDFDGQLDSIIPMVNDAVERYCDRSFYYGSYTERNRGRKDYAGMLTFQMRNTPIAGLTSVSIKYYGVPTFFTLPLERFDLLPNEGIAKYSFSFEYDGRVIRREFLPDYFYYDIVYSGGYVDLPASVKLATVQAVASTWDHYFSQNTVSGSLLPVEKFRIGDYEMAYLNSAERLLKREAMTVGGAIFPVSTQMLLQPFVRSSGYGVT